MASVAQKGKHVGIVWKYFTYYENQAFHVKVLVLKFEKKTLGYMYIDSPLQK